MTQTPEIKGNRILILGFGREGKSIFSYLKTHMPAVSVSIADKSTVEAPESVTVYSGNEYLSHIREFDTIIRSPGVSPFIPDLIEYVKGGGYITSATNIFFSQAKGRIVGVTGTKGKSTTSALIAHILKETHDDVRLVGNIGEPMMDHIKGASDETIYVAELSSHMLEDIRYSPHVAVILNVVPEHLDYYPDFDTYVRAKGNIVKFQSEKDVVVYNPAFSVSSDLAKQSKGKKIIVDKSPSVPMLLLGNVHNVEAAIAVSRYFRVPDDKIMTAIASFRPLPHRLEYIGTHRSIRFVNDSLATVPEATIHALQSLGPSVDTLIAGGFDRHVDYTPLGLYLATYPVKTLILFPDTGQKIVEAIDSAMKDKTLTTAVFHVTSMTDAVSVAYQHTRPDKICLLSPASASFNAFRDYADRGDQFRAAVVALSEQDQNRS